MSKTDNNPPTNQYGISAKDFYEKMYIRLENDNQLFWNRIPFFISIFGFSFTGYGYLLLQIFTPTSDSAVAPNAMFLQVACLAISGISYLVALFWVIISKGSRYWYERNHETLHALERPGEHGLIWDKDKQDIVLNGSDKEKVDNREKFQKIYKTNIENMPYNFFDLVSIPNEKFKSNVFSNNDPYHYSIGKVQILMGRCLLFFWGIICLAHGGILGCFFSEEITIFILQFFQFQSFLTGLVGIIVILILLSLITFCITKSVTTDNTHAYTLIRKKLGVLKPFEDK